MSMYIANITINIFTCKKFLQVVEMKSGHFIASNLINLTRCNIELV